MLSIQVINFILLTTKRKKRRGGDGKTENLHFLFFACFPQFPHKIRKIAIPYLTSTVFRRLCTISYTCKCCNVWLLPVIFNFREGCRWLLLFWGNTISGTAAVRLSASSAVELIYKVISALSVTVDSVTVLCATS